MLRVRIHGSTLAKRGEANQLAILDIAYDQLAAKATYLVALTVKGRGEMEPDKVIGYPRWSASLWDLVARALTRVLYHADDPPALAAPDRRCAYATQLCAVIERARTLDDGVVVGQAEILRDASQRGHYDVHLWEDINGERRGRLVYGAKRLDHCDLLLRALCVALYGKDTLGPKPALLLPSTIRIDGREFFDVQSLPEPARTGFIRHLRDRGPRSEKIAFEALMPAEEYASFLMRG